MSVDDILANPLSHVCEVPKALHVAWAHVMAGAPRGPGAFPPIGQVRVGEPEAAPSPGVQARERLAWGLAAAEAKR